MHAIHQRFAALALAAVCTPLLHASSSLGNEPKFQRQTIDGEIQIGYGLAVGRVDDDEHADLLLADKSKIVWYENPGVAGPVWTKHVIASDLTSRDNVCLAARDLNGDGLVEVAVGANWNPGVTDDVTVSGALFYLVRPDDPTKRWRSIPITPYDPTTHRMKWIKMTDGFRLAVLPLHGVGNRDGEGETVRISLYDISGDRPRLTDRIDTEMHMTHNFDLAIDPASGKEQLLVAGKEGYVKIDADGELSRQPASELSKGAGEVRRIRAGTPGYTGIEPMHGSDVVLYERNDAGEWNRRLLDESFNQGHALATADLCGDDAPEIVAGWRNPNAQRKVGIKVFWRDGDKWAQRLIDDNGIACEDLLLHDFDSDGKLDVAAAGRATKNVVIYWNQSP